jgi:hypothetical protein
LTFPAGPASAEDRRGTILDADSGILFPPIQGVTGAVAGEEKPAGLSDGVTLTIISVTNQQGNNPFDPLQPVLNYNGQQVSSVDDPIRTIQGGAGPQPAVQSCLSSIRFAQSPSAPPGIYFAGIDYNANTGNCFLRSDGQGQTLIIQTPPNGPVVPPGSNFEAFPDRLVANWEFFPPSPVGGAVTFVPGTAQTFFVRATNGVRLQIQLNAQRTGPTTFTMNVTSLTRLP